MRHTLEQATRQFEAGAFHEAEAACAELLALLPGDPPAQRLLGLIAAAGQNFAQALQLLIPLDERFANDLLVQTALAEALWATHSAGAAVPYFQRVLHLAPERHRVRGRLGTALLQAGQTEAARQELSRAVAARPDDAALLLQLGLALRDLGDLGAAIEALRTALRHDPHGAHLHLALGDALLEAGDVTAAMASLAQAVQRDPTLHMGWMLLARAATLAGLGERAVSCLRRALVTVPEDGEGPVRAALANALHVVGAEAEAAATFAAMMRSAEGRLRRFPPRQRRVGVLAAPGAANTPTEFVLDRTALGVETLFVIAGYDYPAADLHARFDTVFNAISDPDAAPAALTVAAELGAAIGRPIINPPGAILATTRDAMAARLAGLPGSVVPKTLRCDRVKLCAGAAPPLRFPLLIRPIGSHGGNALRRVEDARALAAAAAALPGAEVYLTEYHAFGSADGYWRKYRVVFVGAEAFPYHLSIGPDWLNHYFRTDTNRDAQRQAEETAFLRQPESTLGPLAWRALAALPDRVGLDYFGVDFALDSVGRLIVFECNAAMRVRAPREAASVKARVAGAIRDALTQRIVG